MTNPIDLNPNHLATVQRILAEHVPACEVRAFGSRATWTAKDYSDLDLAIVGTGPLDRITLGRLKGAFEESVLPMRVDVLDWHAIPESFRDEIKRDYVVLWEGTRKLMAAMKRELVTTDLGSVLSFSNGRSSPPRNNQAPYPVYGSNGIIGFADQVNACPNTIVIGRVGSYCGSLHYSSKSSWVTDNAIRATAINENDEQFLYYLLQTLSLNEWRAGSGQPLLNQSILSSIPVQVPPLPEQRAIAHILGTLDDKIELNRRMNETLEEMARALFKSWFVDFDPVRAKMDGRWRPGQSLPGLPAEHYELFPDRLVDSELGEIPEGWEVGTLGDVIEVYDSRRVPLNSRQRASRQGPYPYYGAAGVMDYVDDFLFDGVYVLTGEDGTVIDTDGHPVVQYIWGQFWVNNHAHVLKGKGGISDEHLYLLLQQADIQAFVTGAVQPKLNQKYLRAIPAVLPDESVCYLFSDLLQPIFATVRSRTEEFRDLAQHRDAMLPKLVSGEVRACEAPKRSSHG